MISLLKLFALTLLVGSNTSYWGHTYLAQDGDKFYALRSTSKESSLCTFGREELKGRRGLIQVATAKIPMEEFSTEGKESCHITLLDREAVVSDYTSGTLSLYPLDEKGNVAGDVRLLHFSGSGPHPTRQKSSHIHSSALSPNGRMLAVVDLGTDRIYFYAVRDGRVVEPYMHSVSLPAGCGPRFSTFSANGNYLYVVTELSDEVMVLRTSDFALINKYPLHTANPEGGAHIALSPNGKYLYASLRVSRTAKASQCNISDGIAIYKCYDNGALKKMYYLPTGAHPRHFALAANGAALIVACRDSNSIEIYPLEIASGLPKGEVEKIPVNAPVYVGVVKR